MSGTAGSNTKPIRVNSFCTREAKTPKLENDAGIVVGSIVGVSVGVVVSIGTTVGTGVSVGATVAVAGITCVALGAGVNVAADVLEGEISVRSTLSVIRTMLDAVACRPASKLVAVTTDLVGAIVVSEVLGIKLARINNPMQQKMMNAAIMPNMLSTDIGFFCGPDLVDMISP